MNHLSLPARAVRRHRALVVIGILTGIVAMFAYQLFVLHGGEHVAHGFDVSAPLLGERIVSFLIGSAE